MNEYLKNIKKVVLIFFKIYKNKYPKYYKSHTLKKLYNISNILIIIIFSYFLYPPQRGYISFVNTFVTPRNHDLGPYAPWRHLISAKF